MKPTRLSVWDQKHHALTASGAHPLPPVRHGRATLHLPALGATDSVHVAGHPGLVSAVMREAARAGATAYGIPHVAAPAEAGVVERIARYLSGSQGSPGGRVPRTPEDGTRSSGCEMR